MNDENISKVAVDSDGFSGSDIKNLCAEVSMQPLREAVLELGLENVINREVSIILLHIF